MDLVISLANRYIDAIHQCLYWCTSLLWLALATKLMEAMTFSVFVGRVRTLIFWKREPEMWNLNPCLWNFATKISGTQIQILIALIQFSSTLSTLSDEGLTIRQAGADIGLREISFKVCGTLRPLFRWSAKNQSSAFPVQAMTRHLTFKTIWSIMASHKIPPNFVLKR